MRRLALLLAIFLLPSLVYCHAAKLGTTPSSLSLHGEIGMQIDVENVVKDVPFNAFFEHIGPTTKFFTGNLALALIAQDGEIKEIIKSVSCNLEPGWGYGQTQNFCSVKCTVDISDSDIIRFIAMEYGANTWLPVESETSKQTYCKVKDNKIIKSKVTVNVIGKNPIEFEGCCSDTYHTATKQPEPIYGTGYKVYVNWPADTHQYLKIDPHTDGIQKDTNGVLIQGVNQPEYTVTIMACYDEDLITEQRHYTVKTPGTLREQVINDKDLLYINNISVSGLLNDDDFAFMRDDMPMLEHIDLSDADIVGGMLPNNAFHQKEIRSIILPKNIWGLGYNSLSETKLKHLDIPASVDYYELNALNYSTQLTTIVLHNPNVIPVSWCVLEGTNRSKGVLFVPEGTREQFAKDEEWGQFALIVEADNADDYVSFDDGTYRYSGIYPNLTISAIIAEQDIMFIPETVQYNNRTFNVVGLGERLTENIRISEIHIPKSVTTIGEYACCSKYLKKIEVDPENPVFFSHEGVLYNRNTSTLLKIPRLANIEEYEVPEGIKNIEGWASYNFYINKITFPTTLEKVGSCAFYYESYIRTIICKAITPPTLLFSAFDDNCIKYACVYVPSQSFETYKADPNWGRFLKLRPLSEEDSVEDLFDDSTSINIIGNSINVTSKDPYEIYSIDGKLFYKGNEETVTLPNGLYILKINGVVKKIKI